MTDTLSGKTVAFLAADGVEESEYTEPRKAVEAAGATAELISLQTGEIQAYESDVNPTNTYPVERVVADADASAYAGLVLPGGTTNPDKLRTDPDAVAFVKAFFAAGKPVAAICHGPWTLVEADVVGGRTVTSFPSLQTDLRNAGATWVDKEVVVDEGLVTSRTPDDLEAFCAKVVEEIGEGAHAGQHA